MNEPQARNPDASAAEKVVGHVKARLLSGQLKPGDRLPAERELAATLGIGRPALREGLRALALLGLIDVRQGSGTFVCEPDPAILRDVTTMALAHLPDAVADAMQARIAIECQAIRLACERASEADLAVMETRLEALLDTLHDPVEGGLADMAFHDGIVAASHCAPLIALHGAMADLLRPLHIERRRTTTHIDGIRDYLVEAHREVFLAMVAREPEKADRQLRQHFAIGEEFRRAGNVTRLARKFASSETTTPQSRESTR